MYLQQSFYDFRYNDEDTVMNEIDEFYSYVEMPQVAENLKAWRGSFQGGKFCALCFRRPIIYTLQNGQALRPPLRRERLMSSFF